MPTCTEIVDALNTLASATTNPNSIMDLTGATASLSVPYGDIAKVQLSAGGDAVLSVPSGLSIDGKIFKITATGYATQTTPETSDNCTIRIWNGTNLSTATIVTSVSVSLPAASRNFTLVFNGFWDSTTQRFTNGSSFIQTVSSQSGFQFVVSAQTSGSASDPGDTLVLTQLKLELV